MIKITINIQDNLSDNGCKVICEFENNNPSIQEQNYCKLLSDACQLALTIVKPDGKFHDISELVQMQTEDINKAFPDTLGE